MKWLSLAVLISLGCARAPTEAPLPPPAAGEQRRCVVHLHGKGQRGAASSISGGLAHVWPSGNSSGWGGRQWLYFPDDRLAEVREIVAKAVAANGCAKVALHGFSNGAAAAAKLYCSGESLGARLAFVLVDDPVPDHGADHCTPAPGVKLKLYSTGALTQGAPGASCAAIDWTCEGGSTIGLEAYARALRTEVAPSVHREHKPFAAPPEYTVWF